MTLAELERRAESARADLSLGDDSPIPDIVRLIEDEGHVHVAAIPFPDGGPDGVYAVQRGEPFIIVNSATDPVRQRFTLAHEFGHHVFGDGSVWDQSISLAANDPKEVRANQFAAAFLMPRAALDRWFSAHDNPDISLGTLVRLANFFGVSAKAARIRLEKTGRLRPGKLLTTLDQAIDRGEHLALARQIGLNPLQDSIAASHRRFRVTSRMRTNYLQALASGRIDAERTAARLHADVGAVERAVADAGEGANEEGLPALA